MDYGLGESPGVGAGAEVRKAPPGKREERDLDRTAGCLGRLVVENPLLGEHEGVVPKLVALSGLREQRFHHGERRLTALRIRRCAVPKQIDVLHTLSGMRS